jgi:Holliday junction resolvase RusA-like endonuclease
MKTTKPQPKTGASWRFDLTPVPASRPRIGRYGVHYSKHYERFRREAKVEIPRLLAAFTPLECALELWVVFYAEKPRTGKKLWPKGDVDNFEKAILDSLNEHAFKDDDQIIDMHSSKRYATGQPHILVTVSKADHASDPFGDLYSHFYRRFTNPT